MKYLITNAFLLTKEIKRLYNQIRVNKTSHKKKELYLTLHNIILLLLFTYNSINST